MRGRVTPELKEAHDRFLASLRNCGPVLALIPSVFGKFGPSSKGQIQMAIVRQDKRPQAIAALAEVRRQLRGLLHTVDALQAQVEAIELDLGLANEGEQAQRDQCMVLHYPAGSDVGHVLSDCTEACVTAEDASEEGDRIVDALEGPSEETQG